MMRWLSPLAAACTLAAAPAAAQEPHCQRNVLGEAFCAKEPNGVAVVDALGVVVCAPGRCVRGVGDDDEWHCSYVPGGDAHLDPAGEPLCEGGCRTPRAGECEQL
jgi:hypothetical protein